MLKFLDFKFFEEKFQLCILLNQMQTFPIQGLPLLQHLHIVIQTMLHGFPQFCLTGRYVIQKTIPKLTNLFFGIGYEVKHILS